MDLLQLLRKGKVSIDRMLPPATRAVLSPQMARRTSSIVSSAKGLPSFPAALGSFSGKVAGRMLLPLGIYETGKNVGWDQQGNFNPKIIRELGALGTSIENLSTGKPSSAGRTQAQQQNSGRPVGTQAVLGGKPVYWGGDDYGWQQLNQSGSSATLNSLNSPSAQGRFIQDQGYSPAAERAYRQEASRVAQITAQDPELKRYELAREGAKTQEEMNAARDIGMQIWAQKYGGPDGLASKVKPGSTGYEAIQGAVGSVMPSALSNEQVQGTMSFDPNTVLSTAQQIQGQFRPNQQLTDQEVLAAMSFDPNAAMRSAANIAFAPMSSAESGMLKEVGGAQGEYITPMNAIGAADQAGTSFVTPAEVRRQKSNDLFQALLNRATVK